MNRLKSIFLLLFSLLTFGIFLDVKADTIPSPDFEVISELVLKENKTILVTGASSGIGKAIAIECSKMGAKVVITGRNEQRLQETYKQLEGLQPAYIVADLTKREDIETLINQIGSLNGLVNCAGLTIPKPFKFLPIYLGK